MPWVAGAGILGSAPAYALYFRLIADIGPVQALTVTVLMPVFGMGFGWMFLDEVIDARMLAGAALVVAGTALALLSPSRVAARLGRRDRFAGVALDQAEGFPCRPASVTIDSRKLHVAVTGRTDAPTADGRHRGGNPCSPAKTASP